MFIVFERIENKYSGRNWRRGDTFESDCRHQLLRISTAERIMGPAHLVQCKFFRGGSLHEYREISRAIIYISVWDDDRINWRWSALLSWVPFHACCSVSSTNLFTTGLSLTGFFIPSVQYVALKKYIWIISILLCFAHLDKELGSPCCCFQDDLSLPLSGGAAVWSAVCHNFHTTQPTRELIEADPRASYCPKYSCVRVYCKSPAQRWSCQTSKYYALEVEQVCGNFRKTWKEYTSDLENFDYDDVWSAALPWCGSKSPAGGYKYVSYSKGRLHPSSWSVRTMRLLVDTGERVTRLPWRGFVKHRVRVYSQMM